MLAIHGNLGDGLAARLPWVGGLAGHLAGAAGRWMQGAARRVRQVGGTWLAALAYGEPDLATEELSARSLQRLARGEQDAMAELYDRYAPTVFALALRMLRDRPGAEEVVQECFWRVWRSAERFDSLQGGAGAWIYSIGRNAALDALRRAKVRPAPPMDGPLEAWIADQADPAGEPAADVLRAMALEQVRTAVGGLEGAQREVIELAYFEGLTRLEIAERTGVPLGTVHTRARLALGKLRHALSAPQALGDPAGRI